MAVKYVKDFAFDSGFGFTGSSGGTPVKSYMRSPMKKGMGGGVKVSPKAPALAPAMVEQRSKGLGGLTPETKKLASYDRPHMEGKKGAKVPQYAKGGAVKKAHAKKPMGKMMKKANGGPVAEITEGDGMSPLQAMAMPMPEDEGRIIKERMLPELMDEPRNREMDKTYVQPIWEKLGMTREQYLNQAGRPAGMDSTEPKGYGLLEAAPTVPLAGDDGGRIDFLRQLMERDTQRMRGDAAQQMRDLEMSNIPVKPPREPGYALPPIGDLTPVPEEPNYVGPAPRALDMIQVDDMIMTREDAERMRPNVFGPSDGTRARLNQGPVAIEPSAVGSGVRSGTGSLRDLGVGLGRLPSPLAAAARMPKADRREMVADRREAARDIMDRYIAGPRRAMPAAGRRGVPVAPRKPMIDRSMLQPYMPTYDASKDVAPSGFVASPEARYAKGGKVSKGEKKIGKVMGEFKRGELHSGSKQGPLVTNPKQAKAIALSEARAAGAKIPKKAMGGKACG